MADPDAPHPDPQPGRPPADAHRPAGDDGDSSAPTQVTGDAGHAAQDPGHAAQDVGHAGQDVGHAGQHSGGASKPAILQESHFIVEEGILHRTFRTGAIWLNKLFFSAAALWAIWLLIGYSQGLQDCAGGIGHQGNNSSQDFGSVAEGTCSVLLTTTSKYLGAMTLLSFLGSVGLGLLGLMVGKRVVEMTPTKEEAGSEEHARAVEAQAATLAEGTDRDPAGGPGDRS